MPSPAYESFEVASQLFQLVEAKSSRITTHTCTGICFDSQQMPRESVPTATPHAVYVDGSLVSVCRRAQACSLTPRSLFTLLLSHCICMCVNLTFKVIIHRNRCCAFAHKAPAQRFNCFDICFNLLLQHFVQLVPLYSYWLQSCCFPHVDLNL